MTLQEQVARMICCPDGTCGTLRLENSRDSIVAFTPPSVCFATKPALQKTAASIIALVQAAEYARLANEHEGQREVTSYVDRCGASASIAAAIRSHK